MYYYVSNIFKGTFKKLSKNFVYIDIFYNFVYITIKIKCL